MLKQMGMERKEGSKAKKYLSAHSPYVTPSKSFIMGQKIDHHNTDVKSPKRNIASGYFIQAGSFKLLENAEDMVHIINSQLEYNVLTFPVEINRNILYKVQVGPFENKNIATQVLEDIRYMGNHDAQIVKY